MKQLKKSIWYILSFLLVLALTLTTTNQIKRIHAQALLDSSLHNAFTVWQHTELAPASDSGRPTRISHRRILAHWSDGSTFTQVENIETGMVTRDFVDASRQLRRSVADGVSSVSTQHLSAQETAAAISRDLLLHDPSKDCLAGGNEHNTILGHETMLNIAVTKIRVNVPGPVDWVVYDAPALNCSTVAQRTDWRSSAGISTETLDRVSIGEPDRSLLEVPSYYAELSPSELARKKMVYFQGRFPNFAAKPGMIDNKVAQIAEKQDAAYVAHQK